MKRGLSAIASAAIVGGSLFLGAGAASATTCPAGYHPITMGGTTDCMPDASGGGNGGDVSLDLGGSAPAAPSPVQMPARPAPTAPRYTPPVYTAPQAPSYAPRVPAPAAPYVPAAPQAPAAGAYSRGGYSAPAAGQAPAFTAPDGAAVVRNPEGVWVDPSTGAAAAPDVAAQADQAVSTAPAKAAAKASAARKAAAAASARLQAAKEASVQEAADIALARRQVEAAVTKALDNALAGR